MADHFSIFFFYEIETKNKINKFDFNKIIKFPNILFKITILPKREQQKYF